MEIKDSRSYGLVANWIVSEVIITYMKDKRNTYKISKRYWVDDKLRAVVRTCKWRWKFDITSQWFSTQHRYLAIYSQSSIQYSDIIQPGPRFCSFDDGYTNTQKTKALLLSGFIRKIKLGCRMIKPHMQFYLSTKKCPLWNSRRDGDTSNDPPLTYPRNCTR